jgi:hypothetical protein
MNTLQMPLRGEHTGAGRRLYMAFELSDKQWTLLLRDWARWVLGMV